MEINFLYPRFLLLLLLIPVYIFIYFFSLVYNKRKALVYANFEAMERFYDIEFFSKNFMALYLNIAILVLIVFSIAGTGISFDADASAFSHIILIDTSQSMSAVDLSPNRLAAAQEGARRFVDKMPKGTEIGVISFSGDSKILHLLDTNKVKIKSAIDEVFFGDVPGTNVYNALVTANKVFGSRKLKSVLLISDGQSNIHDTKSIIDYIQATGLVVNSLAIGTDEGGVTNQNVVSKVNRNFLKALAFNSGGQFFTITDEKSMSDAIDKIVAARKRKVNIDLSFYFLILALILFTLNWILHNLRFRVVP